MIRVLRKACLGCGLVTRTGSPRCAACTKARGATYWNQDWRKMRLVVLARDPVCQIGLPGCTHLSTAVDHIVPVSRGGKSSTSNLQGACKACNAAKRDRT